MQNLASRAGSPTDYVSRAYLQRVRSAPFLSETQEAALVARWYHQGDHRAQAELVTAHLRLTVKLARSYRGYGLPLEDLISEGTLGLMQALQRYEPERGVRLGVYAGWWIRAAIHAYVISSWSLVKIATTGSQRKLFFKLRGLKAAIQAAEQGDMSEEDVERIAQELDVPPAEVVSMNQRLSGCDLSLSVPIGADGDGNPLQDLLTDDRANQETELAHRETDQLRSRCLAEAMQHLRPRERQIFVERRLSEPPLSLEQLGAVYGVSGERVRQIEMHALGKVEREIRLRAAQLNSVAAARAPASSRMMDLLGSRAKQDAGHTVARLLDYVQN